LDIFPQTAKDLQTKIEFIHDTNRIMEFNSNFDDFLKLGFFECA